MWKVLIYISKKKGCETLQNKPISIKKIELYDIYDYVTNED